MRRRWILLIGAVVAVSPAAAREQSFRLEFPAGKDIQQHIEIPLDRSGALEVEAEWSGGRTLRFWIEGPDGESLARWGGTSPGRLSLLVGDHLVDPERPVVLRLRSLGRRGRVDGWVTVRYPSLSDAAEPSPAEAPPERAVPTPEPATEADRWAGQPHAGTYWPNPLRRLARLVEPDEIGTDSVRVRALLEAAQRVARDYLAVKAPISRRDDPDGEPTPEEWERIWTLEDLGRQTSGMIRLADESGIPEEAAADLRRILANIADLARRREEGGERGETAAEALRSLTDALTEVCGAEIEEPPATDS